MSQTDQQGTPFEAQSLASSVLVGDMVAQLQEEVKRRTAAERNVAVLAGRVEELEKMLTTLPSSAEVGNSVDSVETRTNSTAVFAPSGNAQPSQVAALLAENTKLRSYVKRQSALIDVLRRQKILLEAAAALTISSKEFCRDLELESA